jgi:hypothetical protein
MTSSTISGSRVEFSEALATEICSHRSIGTMDWSKACKDGQEILGPKSSDESKEKLGERIRDFRRHCQRCPKCMTALYADQPVGYELKRNGKGFKPMNIKPPEPRKIGGTKE